MPRSQQGLSDPDHYPFQVLPGELGGANTLRVHDSGYLPLSISLPLSNDQIQNTTKLELEINEYQENNLLYYGYTEFPFSLIIHLTFSWAVCIYVCVNTKRYVCTYILFAIAPCTLINASDHR